MTTSNILLSNLTEIPIICFISGFLISLLSLNFLFRPKIHSLVTYFLLFCIGIKGGGAFMQNSNTQFILLLGIMTTWGFFQPFISYWMLRKFTKINQATAAAVAACFGSVSVMTFAAASSFLDKLHVPYDNIAIAILALMEVPAIISGILIFKWQSVSTPNMSNIFQNLAHGKTNTPELVTICMNALDADSPKQQDLSSPSNQILKRVLQSRNSIWVHTIFNKTILMILLGMSLGILLHQFELSDLSGKIVSIFKPSLCLFLFNMGMLIGRQKKDLNQFSLRLGLFGIYMPLIGAAIAIAISYLFKLDPGTATLITVLSASASYIAAPAAMRIAVPDASESIYLPLSLAIAFPFNVVVGIPLYYVSVLKLLS